MHRCRTNVKISQNNCITAYNQKAEIVCFDTNLRCFQSWQPRSSMECLLCVSILKRSFVIFGWLATSLWNVCLAGSKHSFRLLCQIALKQLCVDTRRLKRSYRHSKNHTVQRWEPNRHIIGLTTSENQAVQRWFIQRAKLKPTQLSAHNLSDDHQLLSEKRGVMLRSSASFSIVRSLTVRLTVHLHPRWYTHL